MRLLMTSASKDDDGGDQRADGEDGADTAPPAPSLAQPPHLPEPPRANARRQDPDRRRRQLSSNRPRTRHSSGRRPVGKRGGG